MMRTDSFLNDGGASQIKGLHHTGISVKDLDRSSSIVVY